MEINDIFIAGTDTGVGKTVCSLLLMQYFRDNNFKPAYLKPVQTGCRHSRDTESDACFISMHAGESVDPDKSILYCLPQPRAPLYAALNAGRRIDWEQMVQAIVLHRQAASPLIVESAGGLFVPVDAEHLWTDLLEEIAMDVVLIARAGLGTINHTLLSLEALQNRGITPKAVLFMDAGDPPTDPDMVEENMEAVSRFAGVNVAGVIQRIQDFSCPDPGVFSIFDDIWGEYRHEDIRKSKRTP